MFYRPRSACPTWALPLGILVLGCSSPTEPEPSGPPTIMMMNPTCDGSGCRAIQVRAFVWDFTVPQSPTGFKVIDVVDEPMACISFPPMWELTVSEDDSSGQVVHVDTLTWTPDGAVYVTVLDLETLDWLAATETFVPGAEEGWELAFSPGPAPGGLPYISHLSSSKKCNPS